jgi:hypothetical protein
MERRAEVELFEEMGREYEFGIGTIQGVASKLGVHRRMVRQALARAEPPARKRSRRERPAIGPVRPFIDAILEADRNAPRKQRHMAHRSYERITNERPEHKVAEVTVRVYVRERKRELGWSVRSTSVPQSYAPGQEGHVDWYEGHVDWYEAWAELNGAPVKLQVFSLRSMVSGAAFHRAYYCAAQPAVELGAVQDDLLGMHRIDCAHRHSEVTRILDVDYKLRPTARRNVANGPELLAPVRGKNLESHFDFFLHDVFLHCAISLAANSSPYKYPLKSVANRVEY